MPNSVFEGWDDVDVEEYLDADQDGDSVSKQRIAEIYGMRADDIVKICLTPYQAPLRRRVMGHFWRWWYRIFPHPLER